MTIIAFIFARGGSKGIPRKNLCMLGGKPLLAWAIDAARSCPLVDRIIVSTDDREIADVALERGAEVPFIRPADLAQDSSPEWRAWQHAVRYIMQHDGTFDIFLSVPTTSPLRSPDDLSRCVAELSKGGCEGVISVTPANRNPYFNMVCMGDDGQVEIAIKGSTSATRQSAPPIYDITTVAYAVRPEHILTARSLFEGRIRAIQIPKERSIDIDDAVDMEFARFLVESRGRSI
jgi:N,N'-diacetyl-8-epilegionaminate cytidylyltransferase